MHQKYNIYTKPPKCVEIYNPLYITRFSELVPWKHESDECLSGHQLGKLSDVQCIMSTNKGSFVFIIHNLNYTLIKI